MSQRETTCPTCNGEGTVPIVVEVVVPERAACQDCTNGFVMGLYGPGVMAKRLLLSVEDALHTSMGDPGQLGDGPQAQPVRACLNDQSVSLFCELPEVIGDLREPSGSGHAAAAMSALYSAFARRRAAISSLWREMVMYRLRRSILTTSKWLPLRTIPMANPAVVLAEAMRCVVFMSTMYTRPVMLSTKFPNFLEVTK